MQRKIDVRRASPEHARTTHLCFSTSKTTDRTIYEKIQDYNRLTRYLHSGRYKALVRLVKGLQAKLGDRRIRVLEIGWPGNGC